jgi:hypothetical protein
METMTLLDDAAVVARILHHIDHRTTDLGETSWREPVEHYRSPARFAAEIERVLRSDPAGHVRAHRRPRRRRAGGAGARRGVGREGRG